MQKYRTIVVDPPWKVGSLAHTGRNGHHIKPMNSNYEMMSMEEIKSLPIDELACDNAYLFLWTTHTFLPMAFDLVKAWKFKYHLTITWDKGRSITHYGFHRKSEFCLFCYNGKLEIDVTGKSISTVLYEYNKGHSVKPDIFYSEIERKFPEPRLDMFARRPRSGWSVFGNEVEGSIRLLTPLALDGGDSAALQALSTPEVLSILQGESTPAHRK
jgi:N6-adenosine-specific RNA methylase IME4